MIGIGAIGKFHSRQLGNFGGRKPDAPFHGKDIPMPYQVREGGEEVRGGPHQGIEGIRG